MSYESLKQEVEQELEGERNAFIKSQLRKRMEKKLKLQKELQIVDKEIDLLVELGEVTNLEDYIKIDSRESTHINLGTPSNNSVQTIGMHIEK